MRDRRVVIDFHPGCDADWPEDTAVVVVDVIRATTTAITAVALGRRCYPVASVAEAHELARSLRHPLLVGECGGERPAGFDLTNSPAALAAREDVARPMILLSSSGTQLLGRVRDCRRVYVASLRNLSYMTAHLAVRHRRVALLGAGTRGEFREEDQMCCARIAEGLTLAGFQPEDRATEAWIGRWAGAPHDAFLMSRSVTYLRASEQEADLDFILAHYDDLPAAFALAGREIVALGAGRVGEATR
jgi:2-phosphosulfolactate phosphatase